MSSPKTIQQLKIINNLSYAQYGDVFVGERVANSTGVITFNAVVYDNGSSTAITLTGKTITSGTFKNPVITDSNNNSMLSFTTTASSVNYFTLTNAATAGSPTISFVGSDANVSGIYLAQAAGTHTFTSTSSSPFIIKSGTSAQHTSTFAFSNNSNSRTITFPDVTATVTMLGNGSTGSGNVVLTSGPTISSPLMTGTIKDANNNNLLGLVLTGTAVNYLTITNAAAAGSPTIGVLGSDTDIGFIHLAKAAGTHTFTSTSSSPFIIKSGTSAQHTTTFTFGNTSSSRTITFPDVTGTVTLLGNGSTGSGNVVLDNTPTLITPNLGTPTSGTLTNCTGFPVANLSGLGTGVATFLATPSSANLITAMTDETGTGSLVFANAPTMTSPNITTPKIITSINDNNGNILIGLTATGTAVNYVNITNAATAGGPAIDFTGSDSNINAFYRTKGTGTHILQSASNICVQFRSGTSSQHITNFNFVNTSATRNITIPDADGTMTLLGNTGNGSGNIVLTTSAVLVTPTLGAATATTIAFSPTTGGIIGTATNDSPTAGNVGETITATGTTVAITTATQTNVTSISLTAGDWIVFGAVTTAPAAGTTQSQYACGINTVSATLPTIFNSGGTVAAGLVSGVPAPMINLKLTGTTTVYLVGYVNYAVSTLTISGTITGRRVR